MPRRALVGRYQSQSVLCHSQSSLLFSPILQFPLFMSLTTASSLISTEDRLSQCWLVTLEVSKPAAAHRVICLVGVTMVTSVEVCISSSALCFKYQSSRRGEKSSWRGKKNTPTLKGQITDAVTDWFHLVHNILTKSWSIKQPQRHEQWKPRLSTLYFLRGQLTSYLINCHWTLESPVNRLLNQLALIAFMQSSHVLPE